MSTSNRLSSTLALGSASGNHPSATKPIMSLEEEFTTTSVRPAPAADAPPAIRVEDLHKAFRIPTQRVDSLKERAVHPFAARDYRELRALDGISFEIRKGEFFGIVGRNGSGKSTLLKLLASIYRADKGRIQMAGRLAPFIELGVGFNQELTARDNAVLNGVMMGLTPKESRDRLDRVVEFAELEDFVDLKLKNYSSGMLVRLAFSLMLEVDADILLIDEVLAVGDAAFQQKCADAFHEMKAAGKTIVLVTHEMSTVEEYCHRAMLIHEGHIAHIGEPSEVGRQYLRLNFEHAGNATPTGSIGEGDDIRVIDAHLENESSEAVDSVEHGTPIHLRAELEAVRDLRGVDVFFSINDADGAPVTKFGVTVGEVDARELRAGERIQIEVDLGNPLATGRYHFNCGINAAFIGDPLLFVPNVVGFVVFGNVGDHGMVDVPVEKRATVRGPLRGAKR
jgi:ABC-type polysaccharide/polyol phosphate transport system ATPase subunit